MNDHATAERLAFIDDIEAERDEFVAVQGSVAHRVISKARALFEYTPLRDLEEHRPHIGRPMAVRRLPARGGKA